MHLDFNSSSYISDRVDFAAVKAASLGSIERLVRSWLPSGRREGDEWVATNPTRDDKKPGSFKINLRKGVWSEFATGKNGGDMIDLYRYLHGGSAVDAAKEVGKLLGVGPVPKHEPRRTPDETPKETGAFPPRTPPDKEGKPHFIEAGEEGPPRRGDELRRHVYTNGATAVRIKIMRSGEPRATSWYRVADGKTTGWQSKKPDGFKTGPYVGARDPFCTDHAGTPLWWPEGEKDVESVSDKGGVAFTFGGTGDGLPEGCEEYTRGRDVIILADNDTPGVEHAEKKAARAEPFAKSIRVVHFPDLPEHGDVTDFFEQGRTFADLQKIAAETPLHELPAKPLIRAKPFVLRDPKTLPKRQWVYGKHLIRKFGSATFAPSGSGKSNLFIVEALAMATGRNLLGVMPQKQCRVWYWNGEDPYDELERRVGAACLHYKITPEELDGWLFINSGRDDNSKIIIANETREGTVIAVPVVEALVQTIRENKIDVVLIDPFISSHRVPENNNNAIDAVAKEWTGIADITDIALDLAHHTRKTNGAEVTVEDGRGAVALLNAVRPARVLNVMTEDEATTAGVIDGRRRYFRVTDGKNNNALPTDKLDWYRSASIDLGNGDDPGNLLDKGDDMGVVTKWEWPNAMDGVTGKDFDKAAAAIRAGEWRLNNQAKAWVGHAVAKALGLGDVRKKSPQRAKVIGMVNTWIYHGSLLVVERLDPALRKTKEFVEVAPEPEEGD